MPNITAICDRTYKQPAAHWLTFYRDQFRSSTPSSMLAEYKRMAPMFSQITQSIPNGKSSKPLITSYDSGYEHSFEHYVDVRGLVDEAHEEWLKPAPSAAKLIATTLAA
ncbi:MAG TPA: hypothetical protein VGU90_14615 [Terriglobales bacterium]|nr:hypothetical protein [Terriglobales bacterium]